MWGELACHKRPPPQFSRLGTWCPAFVCMYVYVCVYGGLSSFYIWMEGLCVVGWLGGGGGGGYGFFLVFLFISMLYIRFSCIFQLSDLCLVVLLPRQAVLR